MTHTEPEQPHVLFLFSDTGGGHRSAAEAIIEAINLDFPNRISTEMVDFFKEYAPPPTRQGRRTTRRLPSLVSPLWPVESLQWRVRNTVPHWLPFSRLVRFVIYVVIVKSRLLLSATVFVFCLTGWGRNGVSCAKVCGFRSEGVFQRCPKTWQSISGWRLAFL